MRRGSGQRLERQYATACGWIAYAGVIVLAVAGVAMGVEAFLNSIFEPPAHAARKIAATGPAAHSPAEAPARRTGGLVLTQDQWADMLRDPAYWASRRAGGNGSSYGNKWGNGGAVWSPFGDVDIFAPPPRQQDEFLSNTYRTVCVRLCDGAFFPISFSTTREHFSEDADKCEASCGSASRLYVYRNPGGNPEDMEDLEGRPYKRLPTAFLYKTQYNEQCKCKPHPWEEAALNRHKLYALEAARSKGNKLADASIKDLKAKLRQEELEGRAEKARLEQENSPAGRHTTREARNGKTTSRTTASAQQPAPGLPPPPAGEPTAMYQPQATGRGRAQSTRSTKSDAVVVRMGGRQTKTVRVAPSSPWRDAGVGR